MTQKQLAVVTGGMGGLGESISTKMADAGYKVVVTYSPSNTKYKSWLDEMKGKGYAFSAYPVDVASFEDSAAKCALQHGFVQVVPAPFTRRWLHIESRRREHPVPAPFERRIRVLRPECARKRHAAPSGAHVHVALCLHPPQMIPERLLQRSRQHRHAVLSPFAVSDCQLTSIFVDVLDPKLATFKQAQAGSVHQ